ncbi:MAG: aminodeoxychorismate synthase component I [candidate division WS1 bacterium]|nr:aminodeoxychorismate synthase component I [candidate division WS1 bacterium]
MQSAPSLAAIAPVLNVDREQYEQAIAAIHELIAAGDTYQVNYTCHARWSGHIDPLEYFLALARSHPVPYAAYLNLGEVQVLSLSPELFLRKRGRCLETKPMKGTRPRGRTLEEDTELAQDLVSSEKDRAENLMILDMARNDLGRICVVGSVAVPARFTAERYRSVWQMTSTVTGELRPGVGLREVFAATFPGASITGAPKARTMEIIHELEPEPRGVYTGALGVFWPSGDFTLNLPIRTLVHRDGQWDLGIGAGIVWDSRAGSEYEETLLKASFALRLLPDLRLWETILLTEEREYTFLEEHLARLRRSAEYWGFSLEEGMVRDRLAELAASAQELPLAVRLELDQEGEVQLTPRPAPSAPPGPVRVLLSAQRTDSRDRLLYHKTNQRALYDEERQQAQARGCAEVIFHNERGELTEGAITNLFVRLDGQWLTPPRSAALLPGIWREAFLREHEGREQELTVSRLQEAEAIVVGNSVRVAMEVGEVLDGEGRVLWPKPAEGGTILR